MVNVQPFNLDGIMILLRTICDGFTYLLDALRFRVQELLDDVLMVNAVTRPIGVIFNNIFGSLNWNGQPINEIEFIRLLLGWGLIFYVAYVFFTWLLNIIT